MLMTWMLCVRTVPHTRFAEVRRSVSRAAYVPPEGGLFANLFSTVLSAISVKPTTYVEGDDVEGSDVGRARGRRTAAPSG